MKKNILKIILCGLFSSCSTVHEVLTIPSGQQIGSYKNTEGETVHRTVEYSKSLTVSNPQILSNTYQDIDPKPESDLTYKSESTSSTLGFIDLSHSNEHKHLGIHGGLKANEFILFRLGVSMFASKDYYFGFDASSRLTLPINDFKPFFGLGGCIGDSKKCQTINVNEEICDKKYAFLGYGEAGLQYQNFSIFYRNYNINRAGISIPDQDLVGLGFIFY